MQLSLTGKPNSKWVIWKSGSRFIVRDQGVGLSMLQNVKSFACRETAQRNNQGLSLISVTKSYMNILFSVMMQTQSQNPQIDLNPQSLRDFLWKKRD